MQKEITIKDLAVHLNLSHTTISRALRNHPKINADTIKLVKVAAEKLGYKPNPFAQNLKNKTSKTIGVIVPGIHYYFFSRVISGIEEVASAHGYHIIVSQSKEDYLREVEMVSAMQENRIAGLLISAAMNSTNSSHISELIEKIPVVFFDRFLKNVNASKVVVDDFAGAYMVTEHLIKNGFKQIAHISGPQELQIAKERLNGYKQALLNQNLSFNEILVVNGGFGIDDGISGLKKLLEAGMKPDAIFAITDTVALGVYECANQLGLRIPDDLAVAGFSNIQASNLLHPSLTTVEQFPYEMGKKSATLLFNELLTKERNFSKVSEVIMPELIIRNSTKKN